VEFCLTKLQALHATSSTFAPPHWIDVLNAFGLFAAGQRHDESYRHSRAARDGGSSRFRHFGMRYSSRIGRNRLV